MFKLITEEEEKKLAREYSLRRYIVMVSALSTVLVVGFVGLLPSYLLSSSRKNEALERSRATLLLEGGERIDPVAWIANTNSKITALEPRESSQDPSEYMEALIEAKTSGISITKLSWGSATRSTESAKLLSISGFAQERRSLVDFERAVNGLGLFTSVVLPVSNLARERDIEFTLELGIK